MSAPKTNPYPLVLYVDSHGLPRSFGESSSICLDNIRVNSVSSFTDPQVSFNVPIHVGTISAQTYLGAPVGGVTRLTQLNDVNIPNFDSLDGYILIISSVGASSNLVALPSSTFSTVGGGVSAFSALVDTPSTYNTGELLVYTSTGVSSIASSVFALYTALSSYIPISVSSSFALTTDLTSLMYLSGGTFTGPITGTSATFASISATTYNNLPVVTSSQAGLLPSYGGYTSSYYFAGDGNWRNLPAGTGGGASSFTQLNDTFGSYTGKPGYLVVVDPTLSGLSTTPSSLFALATSLNNYIPTSVSSNFAQTTSLANYIPTSVSSTFAQSSSLANYVPTSVSSLFALDSDLLNVVYLSGNANLTGDLSGLSNSAIFKYVSATTYYNIPVATITDPGFIIALNGASNYYYGGDGAWHILTGGGGGGGASSFSGLDDVFTYAGKGGYVVIERLTENGLSAVPSSIFAAATSLNNYIPTSVSSNFAQTTSLANYIPTSVSSSFAQSSSLANYIPTSVSSSFAQTTSLANYIPTSVSSNFAQTTSLNNYIPTSVSSSFASSALSSTVSNHLTSAVHWTSAFLDSKFINVSGDTMTGTLQGVSALFTAISATNYYNVTATVGSATPAAIGGLQLNGDPNTFYNGSGGWTTGVESSSVMFASGGNFTGSIYGTSAFFTNISGVNFYGVTGTGGGSSAPSGPSSSIQFNNAGVFSGTSSLRWDNNNSRLLANSISATTYSNLPSATISNVGGLKLGGNNNLFYNGSGQWVSGVNVSSLLELSGGTLTGPIYGTSAIFSNISATNYLNVTATVGSATVTSIGGLQLNGDSGAFYNGSGGWTSGVNATNVVAFLSGATFTGPISGPSSIFAGVSATNIYGAAFSSLKDTFTYNGSGGYLVYVRNTGTVSGLSAMPSSTFATTASLSNYALSTVVAANYTSATTYNNHINSAVHWTSAFLDSKFINVSGDAMTGVLSGTSAVFTGSISANFISANAIRENPRKSFRVFDDFLHITPTYDDVFAVTAGTGFFTNNTALNTSSHPGVWKFGGANGGNGFAGMYYGYASSLTLGGGYVGDFMYYLENISFASSITRVGFMNYTTGTTSAVPYFGLYFEYSKDASANWFCVGSSSGSITKVGTSTAVPDRTWVKLSIKCIPNNSADFYVDDVKIGTVSTNFPVGPGTGNINPAIIMYGAGVSYFYSYIDYIDIYNDNLSR